MFSVFQFKSFGSFIVSASDDLFREGDTFSEENSLSSGSLKQETYITEQCLNWGYPEEFLSLFSLHRLTQNQNIEHNWGEFDKNYFQYLFFGQVSLPSVDDQRKIGQLEIPYLDVQVLRLIFMILSRVMNAFEANNIILNEAFVLRSFSNSAEFRHVLCSTNLANFLLPYDGTIYMGEEGVFYSKERMASNRKSEKERDGGLLPSGQEYRAVVIEKARVDSCVSAAPRSPPPPPPPPPEYGESFATFSTPKVEEIAPPLGRTPASALGFSNSFPSSRPPPEYGESFAAFPTPKVVDIAPPSGSTLTVGFGFLNSFPPSRPPPEYAENSAAFSAPKVVDTPHPPPCLSGCVNSVAVGISGPLPIEFNKSESLVEK